MATDYGRDSFCTDGLRSGRLVRGVTLVAQAAYRRLITPRGTLLPVFGSAEDADYGLDVAGFVGRRPKDAEAALPAAIRAELLKDERIADVVVAITKTVAGPAASFRITVSGTATTGEAFTFVLGVSEVTVELLGITEAA